MKNAAGLWIDHSQASIVLLSATGEKTEQIRSDADTHVRFSGGSRSDGPGTSQEEDQQDNRFKNQLNQYYDRVIAVIREADEILIFGPGEAKGELQRRIENQGLGDRIVGVETEDKMTDHEILAKVRQQFERKLSQGHGG